MKKQDRWQRMDFGVGMRVHKSNNHPTEDICDVLAGDYPKTFKFSEWHPLCRCYVTSILCTKEEMVQMQRDILAGKSTNGFRSVNEVRTVPKAFTDWVDTNGDRIMRAKALPYFLKDNGKIIDGKWVMGLSGSSNKKVSKTLAESHHFGIIKSDAIIDRDLIEPLYKNYGKEITFTEIQVSNNRSIAQLLKIKQGECMSHIAADNNHINQIGDDENCVFCSFTYELRRRGFDVKAKQFVFRGKNNITYIAGENFCEEKGKECKGYGILFNNIKPQTIEESKKRTLYQLMDSKTAVGGRYHVSWDWDAAGGHSAIVEKLTDGTLVMYDGQHNVYYDINKVLSGTKNIEIYRVDNATINPEALELIEKIEYRKRTKKKVR